MNQQTIKWYLELANQEYGGNLKELVREINQVGLWSKTY